jgi:hypothetical protein
VSIDQFGHLEHGHLLFAVEHLPKVFIRIISIWGRREYGHLVWRSLD